MIFTLAMYCAGSGRVDRHGALTTGFGLRSQPFDACSRCSRSRTLVKYWSSRSRSRAPTLRLQILGLPGDRVQDAPPSVELADLRVDLRRAPLQEQLLEHPARFVLRRNRHARAGPRQAARAPVDRQRQRREPRQHPDPLGDVLVERNRVAERAAARMRRRGQEADVRRMAAIHVRVRHAAEHGEVVAVLLQGLQVGRGRVVAPAPVGKNWSASSPRLLQMPASAAASRLSPEPRPKPSTPGMAKPSPRPHHAEIADDPYSNLKPCAPPKFLL